MGITSCEQDEPGGSPYVNDPESTILIYAVATNSLSVNLTYDRAEILKAAENIDLKKNNILLCQTIYVYDEETGRQTGEGSTSLLKLEEYNGEFQWSQIQKYDSEIAPLDPKRISQVINYTLNEFPAETYGLFFWSHSTGSQPFLEGRSVKLPEVSSFGQDKTTTDKKYEQINVEELAEAVPDNVFEFIWFDSCYMSNIESIYQFRDKCKIYVGYPTEVLDDGIPYNRVLPYLTSTSPDIIGAVDTFFRYYDEESYWRMCTVAVIDMKNIEIIADYCRDYLKEHTTLTKLSSLKKYTRYSSGPFYDLGDYLKSVAEVNGNFISDKEWGDMLNEVILYKAATPYDFAGLNIDPEKYSGISTHVYNFDRIDEPEAYYQSLDWFKSVFQEKIEE